MSRGLLVVTCGTALITAVNLLLLETFIKSPALSEGLDGQPDAPEASVLLPPPPPPMPLLRIGLPAVSDVIHICISSGEPQPVGMLAAINSTIQHESALPSMR